jgi:hypothetical protein
LEENKHSKLSVGDWITFLSSERDAAHNTVLNFGAILIAFVGLALSSRSAVNWQAGIEAGIIILFTIFAYYRVINPFGKRAGDADKILKKIVLGELHETDDIRKAWLEKK